MRPPLLCWQERRGRYLRLDTQRAVLLGGVDLLFVALHTV
jgi:hypothetical protein